MNWQSPDLSFPHWNNCVTVSIIKSGWEHKEICTACTKHIIHVYVMHTRNHTNTERSISAKTLSANDHLSLAGRQENGHITLKHPPQPPPSIYFGETPPRQASTKLVHKNLKDGNSAPFRRQRRRIQHGSCPGSSRSDKIQDRRRGGPLQYAHCKICVQKEASDKSDISRKRAKCVCHLHWRQWNIMMPYLTYLLVGWVFLHEIWPGRRAHYVNYENINNSNLDDMSLASFCQSRADYNIIHVYYRSYACWHTRDLHS